MQTLGLLHDPGRYGLATDLYQLTMAAGYFENGMGLESATFELFARRLPRNRGYLLAAGLEQAVEYLLGLRFDGASVEYLRALPHFGAVSEGFWEYLREFRFTGDLNAVPEGTVAFPDEPLLQVRGPLIEAQMVETFLLATLNHQTLVASKAARVVDAAAGKGVVEFGARRAHGFDAALYGARAAVIAGCVGTSNVLAGQAFGLDVYGTAAHSFTMAFPRERDSFRAFQRVFPQHCILLIDTYDTLEGARRAVELGPGVRGVRLDSGDILTLSRQVRRILDEGGLTESIIVASGDLNEDSIAVLTREGAPVDLYGVGTELITSRDAPALSGVYKLVSVEEDGLHRPVRKLSPEKSTYPDAKQLYRTRGADGRFAGDVLALAEEDLGDNTPGAEPLLQPVLRGGQLVAPLPPLAEIQSRARAQREALPDAIRRLQDPEPYPLALSGGLAALVAEMQSGG
ncbi:MAG TPA: nicotinate phosphoribosyltransferase [Armatimonadota bacterium]|nr:nicotinate phosphoribosyltransferase [Armatimonadota bacterium]